MTHKADRRENERRHCERRTKVDYADDPNVAKNVIVEAIVYKQNYRLMP